MRVVNNISDIPKGRPVVLATGCFDGVHPGHAKVIQTAKELAEQCGGALWIYTFSPHPAKVLSPLTAPKLISTPEQRRRCFEVLGVDGAVEVPFDRTCAAVEPERFLTELKGQLPALAGIVCGTDWSFGAGAAGKKEQLETFCEQHGLRAVAVPPVMFDGERISSTRIRRLIANGNIPRAERLLRHPYCITGVVVEGRRIGRELGFPTANLLPDNELLPADGVYAATTQYAIGNTQHEKLSAVFIGTRKTFNEPEPVIEAHLLDFSGDLYGQKLALRLIRKLRRVISFPSRAALIEQIKADISEVRRRGE